MNSMISQDYVSMCPSFSSYSSSDRLAEIADRVVVAEKSINAKNENDDEDEDFEFALGVRELEDDEEAPAMGSSIHEYGGTRPVFPVFNHYANDELSTSHMRSDTISQFSSISTPTPSSQQQHPFQNREDIHGRDNYPPSCSSASSEADEYLDTDVPVGEYCIWRPKLADSPLPPNQHCKKSNSTGSSEQKIRWKFRDLLRRNSSEGKDKERMMVLSTPATQGQEISKRLIEAPSTRAKGKGAGSSSGTKPAGSTSAHEVLYMWNRAMKEGEKRKSYLPYRQDILVGCFANVKITDRSLPHF